MTELDLVDAWRLSNSDGRGYTWRRPKPEIHCQLDYFLYDRVVLELYQMRTYQQV